MPVAYGLLDPCDLSLPHLPDRLIGVRIAHISDVHAWRMSDRWRKLAHQLSGLRLDLVFYTGDYDLHQNHPQTAFAAIRQLVDRLRPTIGSFGVFGNHDAPATRGLLGQLPITWLRNEARRLDHAPIDLIGFDCDRPPCHDAPAMLLADDTSARADSKGRLRICLSHYPDLIPTASDLGCDLMFSGHTHGGQCRLPWGRALVNCCGLPLKLTSGVLRHRDLLCAISRGCGSGPRPPRLFSRAHVPIYTLRRSTMPGQRSDAIHNVRPW